MQLCRAVPTKDGPHGQSPNGFNSAVNNTTSIWIEATSVVLARAGAPRHAGGVAST